MSHHSLAGLSSYAAVGRVSDAHTRALCTSYYAYTQSARGV